MAGAASELFYRLPIVIRAYPAPVALEYATISYFSSPHLDGLNALLLVRAGGRGGGGAARTLAIEIAAHSRAINAMDLHPSSMLVRPANRARRRHSMERNV